MPLIAMTREFGALGLDVAMSLAVEHGLEVVHHEQIEQHLADKLAVSDDVMRRYFEGRVSLRERWNLDRANFSCYNAEELLMLALRGNVIIRGLDAIALLRAVPHVLRVRIQASMSTRVNRAMAWWRLADSVTTRHVLEERDRAQGCVAQRWLGKNWQDPAHYHIILNSDQLPIDSCVATLSSIMRDPQFAESDSSRQTLTDLLLATRIRIALEHALGPQHGIEVSVEQSDVVLTGALSDDATFQQAVGLVRGVSGAGHVEYGARSDRRGRMDGLRPNW